MHYQDLAPWQHHHTFETVRHDGERRTRLVFRLTASMMLVEIVVGLSSGSMALLADGLHMGSHTVAIGLAAFAYGYARRHAADQRFSFGTGKVNSLAGFTGALLLAVFALLMAWQSIDRFLTLSKSRLILQYSWGSPDSWSTVPAHYYYAELSHGAIITMITSAATSRAVTTTTSVQPTYTCSQTQ